MKRIKRKYKRKNYRRRKTSRRRGKKSITYMSKINNHLHRRWAADEHNIILTSVGQKENPLSLTFSLDKVEGYTELTSMYDNYKLNTIEMFLMWSPRIVLAATNVSPCLELYSLIDRDSEEDLTEASAKERSRTRLTLIRPQRKYKFTVKPSVLSMVYKTLTSTGYAPKYNQKLDCADVDVPHYSQKFLIIKPLDVAGTYDGNFGTVTIQVRYNMSFYNTR